MAHGRAGRGSALLGGAAERQYPQTGLSGHTRARRRRFSLRRGLSGNTCTGRRQRRASTACLTCFHQTPLPCLLVRLFPGPARLSPSTLGPSPSSPAQAPAHITSLKLGFEKSPGLAGLEAAGHCAAPGEEASAQARGRRPGSSDLEKAWTPPGVMICSSQRAFRRGSGLGACSPGTKEVASAIFLPCPSASTQSRLGW